MTVTTPVHESHSIPAKTLLKQDGITMADIARSSGTNLTTVNNQRLYPKLSSDYLFGSEES